MKKTMLFCPLVILLFLSACSSRQAVEVLQSEPNSAPMNVVISEQSYHFSRDNPQTVVQSHAERLPKNVRAVCRNGAYSYDTEITAQTCLGEGGVASKNLYYQAD